MNSASSPSQEIDQNKLRQIAGIRKVSLAIGHGSHSLNEIDEIVVARQHECINHYTGFAARLNLFEGFLHYKWIAAHRVFVQAPSAGGASSQAGSRCGFV